MRLSIKTLRKIIRESLVARNGQVVAPGDDDQVVFGHLPSELPKSASLEEEDELDEEAWVPGRWIPGDGEPVSKRNAEKLGDKRGVASDIDLDEDENV
jgi:hypothetical protein